MAVKIRLRRMGARNNPFYRVVVADSRYATDGRFIEALGWYDPNRKSGQDCVLKTDRLAYWVGCGAQMSTTVKSLVERAQPHEGNVHAQQAEAEAAPAETAAPEEAQVEEAAAATAPEPADPAAE